MKLFVFETCPFCLRVRIFAGLKGLKPTIATLTPGELPAEIAGRVERFSVPILLDGDELIQGSAEIVGQLDTYGKALLSDVQTSRDYEAWHARIKAPLNVLCYPRMPALAPAELASDSAHEWFVREIPRRIGMSLVKAFCRTEASVAQVSEHLPEAYEFLADPLRYDTIATLADLQSLTMVAELQFPDAIGATFKTLMRRARISPFTAIDHCGRPVQEIIR
ncbi:MAG: hypothetical protein GJ676_06510 [Rhodobacteraceae bacterium]|nr:hypothetical protein [Paracoccaceae bacterium]